MLSHTNKRIRDAIMYPMVKYKKESTKFERLKEKDFTNLFRPEIFKIFTKTKSFSIQVRTWNRFYYPFLFLALLNIIKISNLEQVVIDVFQNEMKRYDELWKVSNHEFKQKNNAEN